MSNQNTQTKRFAIAVSFPGEHRRYVRNVVDRLSEKLGRDRVFYDEWYESELLGLDGDLKLRNYYRDQSELVVPFFSEHYRKPWCGVEWSAIRSMLLVRREEDAVIPVQMDLTPVPGWESIDFGLRRRQGSRNRSGRQVADLILDAYSRRYSTTNVVVEEKPIRLDQTSTVFFPTPEFYNTVIRHTIRSELAELLPTHTILSVEGLPGSGKTYAVSDYAEVVQSNGQYSQVFWHDPRQGETLSELFAYFESEVHLSGRSSQVKSKELLAYLSASNALLVIDDFHHVDQASYEILVKLSVRHPPPCRLIILSRMYVALTHGYPEIARVKVTGLSAKEADELLSHGNKNIFDQEIVNDLVEKTDGLPFAISLFGTLVSEFGRNPKELLSGIMVGHERLKIWLNETFELIDPAARELLRLLSSCTGPFNIGVVRLLAEMGDLERSDILLEQLQRSYMVQNYSTYRWKVHHLVGAIARSMLSSTLQQKVHIKLGRHYIRGMNFRKRTLNEDDFAWAIRAWQEFQAGKALALSQRMAMDLAATAKLRGLYDVYMTLAEIELRDNPERDTWIDYHFAHCCLITGRLQDSISALETVLYTDLCQDATKRLCFTRLYTEALASAGDIELALHKLEDVLRSVLPSEIKGAALAHAKSVEVGLQTKLGEYDKARALAQSLLRDAEQRRDKRGAAVAFARLGIISYLTKGDEALVELSNAVDLFRECTDKRGLAWALSYSAILKADHANTAGATEDLRESIQLMTDMDEYNGEYLTLLQYLRLHPVVKDLQSLISEELNRLSKFHA